MRRYPRPPEIPEDSPEVTAIVDAWWKQFVAAFCKGDLDTMLSMIETFLAEHPDKVPQLFLHEEVQKKNRKSLLTPSEDSIDTFLAQYCKDFISWGIVSY